MTDQEIIDWLERNHARVRWQEYLPDNKRTERVWWVCPQGRNPFTGRTLREAVQCCRDAHGEGPWPPR